MSEDNLLRFPGEPAALAQGWGSPSHINAVAAQLVSRGVSPVEVAAEHAALLISWAESGQTLPKNTT